MRPTFVALFVARFCAGRGRRPKLARPVTPCEHVARDYREGPESFDLEHFEKKTKRRTDRSEAAAAEARRFLARRTNVDSYISTTREIIELLQNVKRDFGFRFEPEMIARNGAELIIVPRKPLDSTATETQA